MAAADLQGLEIAEEMKREETKSSEMVKETRKAIVAHACSGLSRISPLFFVHLLKQSYWHGKGKAVVKYQVLRQHVIEALRTAPLPGPSTYVVYCLNALLLVSAPHDEGLSHLLTSALSYSSKLNREVLDEVEARRLAARLFAKAVLGEVSLNEGITVKLATLFNIEMKDLKEAMKEECKDFQRIKIGVESLILRSIRSGLYSNAVSLLQQFSLQHSAPQDFLDAMIKNNHIQLAESWSVYMGKDMIVSLVEHCMAMKLYKKAYNMVQKYGLTSECPGVSYLYKRSTLKKLAVNGCWDLAEMKAKNDIELIEYMVDLAYENNDADKATDLCHRYCLKDYHSAKAANSTNTQYLKLKDLVKEENVFWVDDLNGLSSAKDCFSQLQVVGLDCEWSPHYLKKINTITVSILQIATGEEVFIFDLIKLSRIYSEFLDDCLKSLFHSPAVLKLGYAFHNDLEQLFHSYRELECFSFCEAILDLQTLSGTTTGGLSALTKSVLGSGLNKAIRMSDWEQRPLTCKQLHYAALDAAVLIPIFHAFCEDPSLADSKMEKDFNWRSKIISCKIPLKHKKPHKKHKEAASADPSHREQQINSQDDCVALMKNCAPEEELVNASCDLFGLSRPGLLKSELQYYTQALGTPLPTYSISQMSGPDNSNLYRCTVTIGTKQFSGRPARSRKTSEYWAAFHALSYIMEGSVFNTRMEHSQLLGNSVTGP